MRYSALLALAGVAAAAPASDVVGCPAPAPAPAAPAAAPAASSPAPVADADFAWDIYDFSYNGSSVFTTPAHQNAYGNVRFTVANPRLNANEAVVCEATSAQTPDFFYGTQTYTCAPVAGDASVTTTFAFDATGAHTLQLSQAWQGGDKHNYTGSIDLDLHCTDSQYENPNWQLGQIYSNTTHACTAADFALKPTSGA